MRAVPGTEPEVTQNQFDPNRDPFGDIGGGGMGGAMMPSQMATSGVKSRMKRLRQQQAALEQNVVEADPFGDNLVRDAGLNRFAGEMQSIEIRSKSKAAATTDDSEDEVASQTYELDGSVTIPSRRDDQLVEIRRLEFGGTPVHVGIPLLSSFAYRKVELVNDSDVALLRGTGDRLRRRSFRRRDGVAGDRGGPADVDRPRRRRSGSGPSSIDRADRRSPGRQTG